MFIVDLFFISKTTIYLGIKMIVTRWQAPVVPDKDQIIMMFEAEGLTPYTESYEPDSEIGAHRHPFDEVRIVVKGSLVMDVAGNKLLLRSGDRILIPSNTKHSHKSGSDETCICMCAKKTF